MRSRFSTYFFSLAVLFHFTPFIHIYVCFFFTITFDFMFLFRVWFCYVSFWYSLVTVDILLYRYIKWPLNIQTLLSNRSKTFGNVYMCMYRVYMILMWYTIDYKPKGIHRYFLGYLTIWALQIPIHHVCVCMWCGWINPNCERNSTYSFVWTVNINVEFNHYAKLLA